MSPTPPTAAASSERSEELRLALVLNGGVSLAVWMGGVAFELNRLVRETHPVYRGLLELTGTAARIDVISGTSAGGINGAALALAQIHDRSLYTLRDVWLDTAGLDRLLRDPDEKDPSSLLRGEDWFLPRIAQAFEALAQGERAPADAVPVLLSLTTTLLDGYGHRRLDDFGAVVEDTVHRARWRFERSGAGDDAFDDPRIVDQLAFAARATASFPVAFEPARFDAGGAVFKDRQPPALKVLLPGDGEAVTDVRYLLDGGILDNRPFEAALEGIGRLPAQGNTRRVLAYVVPDPAAAAEERERDDLGRPVPPTMAQVAWRSLVGIPGVQSIASHMAELREHNDRAERRWRRIVGAMQHVQAPAMLAQAAALLPAYRARRVDGIIDYLLDETEAELARNPGRENAADIGMRRATRQWLASTWRASSQREPALWRGETFDEDELQRLRRLRQQWAARVPRFFNPRAALLGAPHWQWGLYALEFVADLAVELLRRTQRLHALVERWSQGEASVVPGPALAGRPPAESGEDWIARDLAPSPHRGRLHERPAREGEVSLQPLWAEAYRLAREVRQRRRQSDQSAGKIGSSGFVALIQAWRDTGGERPSRAMALQLIEALLGGDQAVEAASRSDSHDAAQALFELLAKLQQPIAQILAAHRAPSGRADVEEAVVEMRAIHAYLFDAQPGAEAPQALDRIAWRVLALEVFEVSAGSRRQGPGARAEVMQISARLKSALGGSSDPAMKLSGMQLAHFGAFYKRSWRANDWTFGCLDGIDRAVRIALNADALQRRYGLRQVDSGEGGTEKAAAYVKRCLRGLAVDSAEPELVPYLRSLWQADEARITAELAWLDQASTVPPPVLECCATALTRRLQLEALRRELPEIAFSLIAERDSGAPPSDAAGVPLLARVAPDGRPATPTPEDAQALVRNGLLGSEKLGQQIGTDLFTRTSSQGLATAHAALSSRRSGLGALNVVFKLTEWPLRILYWLANRLSHASSTAAALEGAALGIGGALVAAALVVEKMPQGALALGWALLAGVVGTTLLRSTRLGAVLLVLLLAGLYALKPVALPYLVAACVAVWVLMQRWGGLPAVAGIVLGAAWWSAGGSPEAVQLLWRELLPFAPPLPGAADPACAAHAEAALRLKQALWPALLVVALVLLSALARTLAGAARQGGGSGLRGLEQALKAALERRRRWRERQAGRRPRG